MRPLPPQVAAVTERMMALLDERLPGELAALYLVGSIAQGDYCEGSSDIDFVAVLISEPALLALTAVHAALAHEYPHHHCDGIYLRPGELSAPPTGHGLEVRAGQLHPQSAGERHPATWLVLADAGIALRGPAPDHRWIAADRDAARQHSRHNLATYWHHWVDMRRSLLSPAGLTLLTDASVAWGCLGIARLHATIATGRVPSKSAAGDYALAVFPQHAAIITEGLRLRRIPKAASRYHSPLTRRRDLLAFMTAVLADWS